MPKCARTALASGLHTGPIIPSHPGDNLLFGTPQRPTQPRFPPIQPTHPFPVITYPTNHQSSHLSSQPLHTQSSNPYLPTTSVMITPTTCDMITSDNSSHSELTTTYKTTPSTVPLSSVNNSFDNFPPPSTYRSFTPCLDPFTRVNHPCQLFPSTRLIRSTSVHQRPQLQRTSSQTHSYIPNDVPLAKKLKSGPDTTVRGTCRWKIITTERGQLGPIFKGLS